MNFYDDIAVSNKTHLASAVDVQQTKGSAVKGALVKGTLVKRYKRFFADVCLQDGSIVTSHCANTGRMTSCAEAGSQVLLSRHDDPKRKLAYTWEQTFLKDGGSIIVNTMVANRFMNQVLKLKLIPAFAAYDQVQPEVKINAQTRIDFLLTDSCGVLPPCYIEVKSVTLCDDNQLYFPDAVSERGRKHLQELLFLKKAGARAVVFFLINRPDGKAFSIARHIDSAYADAYDLAMDAGVEAMAWRCLASEDGYRLGRCVTIKP